MARRPTSNIDFSWRKPTIYVNGWHGGDEALPPVRDQQKREICMCCVIIADMESQLRIRADRGEGPGAVTLSLEQLVDQVERMRESDRVMKNVLNWVIRNGVVAETDYNKNTKRVRRRARRYRFPGWDHFDPEADDFEERITVAIGQFPVITELPMHKSYDCTGKRRLLYRATGEPLYDEGSTIQEGHAVLLTGWGTKTRDRTSFLEYMNSYGQGFGRDGGFGEVLPRKIHWGYAIQLIYVVDP